MDLIVGFYSFLIGAATGSFLAAALYRWENRLSIRGRSQCPGCGEAILPRDNIPIFSWIFLRGRSRCCQKEISHRYFQIELLSATVAVPLGIVLGIWFLFAVALIAIALVALLLEIRSQEG